MELGAQMLIASDITHDRNKAYEMLSSVIEDGSAYDKLLSLLNGRVGY